MNRNYNDDENSNPSNALTAFLTGCGSLLKGILKGILKSTIAILQFTIAVLKFTIACLAIIFLLAIATCPNEEMHVQRLNQSLERQGSFLGSLASYVGNVSGRTGWALMGFSYEKSMLDTISIMRAPNGDVVSFGCLGHVFCND